MSIYGTILSLDEDHRTECAVYEESPPGSGIYELARGMPTCTCGLPDAPLIYQGSHVLPSDEDARGGYVECASIPAFIGRGGIGEELVDGRAHPWLRLGVSDENEDATVVLRREHVERLRDALSEFLAASA